MSFVTPIVRIGATTPNYDLHNMGLLRYVTGISVDNSTPQKLDIFSVVKSDQHKVTAGWLDVKVIELEGMIEASDNTLLKAEIDNLKKALVGVGLTLFISDGTNHRIWYVNTDGEVRLDYDKFYCVAKWNVKFVVANPPYGIEADSNGNPLIETQSFSLTNLQNVFSTVFSGSAQPKPRLQFTIASAATPDLTGMEILNRESGQSVSLSFAGLAPANGDVIVIDSLRREVLFRGRPIAYDGTIPDFVLGVNEIEVLFVTANSNINVASQKVVNDFEIIRSGVRTAQAFVPASGQNMSFVSVALSKVNNPTGNVRIGIMADTAGNPSGTYLGGTVNVDMATIKSSIRWFTLALAGVGITAATTYWLVVDAPGSTANQVDYVKWSKSRTDQGFGALKNHDGTSWVTQVGDMAFRAYTSNSTAQNQIITFSTFTDSFTTTTNRDTPNTTAKWNGTDGFVTMNGVNPIDQQQNTRDTSLSEYCGATGLGQSFQLSGVGTKFVNKIELSLRFNTGNTVFIQIRNNSGGLPGSVIATSQDVTNGATVSFDPYTFNFTTPVSLTAGTTYWVTLYDYGSSSVFVSWGANTAGGYASGVAAYEDCFNVWQLWSPQDFVFKVYTLSYATAENAVTNVLNPNNADVISVSQVPITILTGGGTYQGSFSADNGANYTNAVRDATPFATETIPGVIGNQLKWRGTLQNTVSANNQFITDIAAYWRDGISLDATTKYASQGVVPTATGSVVSAKLHGMKLGTPGDLTVRIENNSAGSPSGTLVHPNATATVSAASISATQFGFIDVTFAGSFTLNAGTTYHIVVRPSATANNSNKVVLNANFGQYAAGEMRRSINTGSSYSGFTSGLTGFDLIFGLYGAGGFNFTQNLDVTYNKLWL